jgi:hypothetical protein
MYSRGILEDLGTENRKQLSDKGRKTDKEKKKVRMATTDIFLRKLFF